MSDDIQISIRPALDGLSSSHVVIVPYFEDEDLASIFPTTQLGGGRLAAAIGRGEIASRLYAATLLHADVDRPALLVMGAGRRDQSGGFQLMRLASAGAMQVIPRMYSRLAFIDRDHLSEWDFARAAVQGAIYGAYRPGLKKTRDLPPVSLEEIIVIGGRDQEEYVSGASHGKAVGEAVAFARDLVNLPANDLTPRNLAARAQDMAHVKVVESRILDEHAMREAGMGAILGVAAGSLEPPRVIVLRYGDSEAPIKLALVGKGVTFDSGGLWLKTGEGMMTMKGDMGGAAAVISAMHAIASLGIDNICVTAYAGCTENMPGGSAMRSGDVLTALNGETIEVLNTDAEGRLVLADVLGRAVLDGATHIVDVATLTGGAVVALGHTATLAAGRPMSWVHQVVESSEHGLERAWAMPIFDDYRRALESDVADIKNVGGRAASALTAAAFLSDFVGDTQWAHLDIAGTSWAESASAYEQKGGTGAAVSSLVSVALRLSATNPG